LSRLSNESVRGGPRRDWSGCPVLDTLTIMVRPRFRKLHPFLPLLALGCARSTTPGPEPGDGGGEIPIHAIQGSGHISALVGRTVTTTGIVTAVAGNGFYLQEETGDGDDATSDGLFVSTSARPGVAVGNRVRVRGPVAEFIPGGRGTANLSSTQISLPTSLAVLATRQPLPRPVRVGTGGRIPPALYVIRPAAKAVNLQIKAQADGYPFHPDTAGIDFYESLEGMRVTVPAPVAVSGTRTFGLGGEVFTLPEEGKHIAPKTARTPRGGIYLQPDSRNRGDQNPEIVQVQFDSDLFPGRIPAITVGDRLSEVSGVMGYSHGSFEVKATESFMVYPKGLRPDTTWLTGTASKLTVATYNVLNLSAWDDDAAQRARLGSQIVHNLGAPDIVALQEIQDNNGETDDGTTDATLTLRALTEAIQTAGGPRYAFFDVPPIDGTLGGAPGGNIRPAFLYNPARVSLISHESLTAAVLGRAGIADSLAFKDSRNPLVAAFEFTGRRFTLINNHLSSRFGSTPVFGAIQPFVQAGEDQRAAQTGALHAYVAHLLAADRRARVAVLGDLNTFEFSDDLTDILPGAAPILTNLLVKTGDDERYSYNFQGNSQLIDHFFVTGDLLQGGELDLVHLNVDFPTVGTVEASDHDPLVARFQ
jgi:predicted extracellular nuclease